MEQSSSPNKRPKIFDPQDDYVRLSVDDETRANGAPNGSADDSYPSIHPARAPRAREQDPRRRSYDPRTDKDRPKSKHVLPGYEPWILVRTKFRRGFVHNTETKESFWRVPQDVLPGVRELELWEKHQMERATNAQWAEEQLRQMRAERKTDEVNKAADSEQRRRRRSESLQQEDEEAMMAELAAQAEHDEQQDVKWAANAVPSLRPQGTNLESDSEYEVVEVTDSEGDEGDDREAQENELENAVQQTDLVDEPQEPQGGPVEFGEGDIAWQLAQMGEEYGLDPGEYGDEPEAGWEQGAEGLELSKEDAANLFRDLLDDYRISPFTPWEKVITDESEGSILNDDRYTILPDMKARRETFDAWVKDRAAQLKAERAAMNQLDPRILYLALLHDKATPKLYWPEFKRKYKRSAEMNDRKLSEKDREKLYRDHVTRMKLPESTRKADLQTLLKGVPLKALNRESRLDSLPQQLLSHIYFISLPANVRDSVVEAHIRKLPPPPECADLTAEQQAEFGKRRDERRKREQAMRERERQVEERRQQADQDAARARRNLHLEERELQQAMAVGIRGLHAQLREESKAA